MPNGNGHNGTYTAAQFIAAIPGTGGIITKIAEKVGCAWHTAKKYIEAYATVKEAYDDECERVVDKAESQVVKAIEDGDMITVRWYLSTKGKDRGYVERRQAEITGKDGGPVYVVNWEQAETSGDSTD